MNDPLPLLVANLKANKTWEEMSFWLDQVAPIVEKFTGTVIVCPSSAFLASTHQKLQTQNSKLQTGGQDISRFEQGAYTGEVAASQIANLCQYAIIGHSERRQNFGETDEILTLKVQNAKSAGIEPIFCIQTEKDAIPEGVEIVAYEPTFAIGTGVPDSPENAKGLAEEIRQKDHFTVIYGGSVSAENVNLFLQKDVIDGVLVGATNSLDSKNFIQILEKAAY